MSLLPPLRPSSVTWRPQETRGERGAGLGGVGWRGGERGQEGSWWSRSRKVIQLHLALFVVMSRGDVMIKSIELLKWTLVESFGFPAGNEDHGGAGHLILKKQVCSFSPYVGFPALLWRPAVCAMQQNPNSLTSEKKYIHAHSWVCVSRKDFT